MSEFPIGAGRTVEVDGVATFYHEAGEGEAVILVHGAGPGASGLSNWSRNIESLARRFRVLTIDLPGVGIQPDFNDREWGIEFGARVQF